MLGALNGILLWSVVGLFLGIALAILPWRLIPDRRRRIQRAVDLLSYAVTLLALGSGVLSIVRYDERLNAEVVKRDVLLRSQITVSAIFDSLEFICAPRSSAASYAEFQVQLDCEKLRDFLTSVGRVNDNLKRDVTPYSLWLLGQPPDPSGLLDEFIKAFVSDMREGVDAYNAALLDYKSGAGTKPDPLESRYLRFAVPLLAFAFGLGIVRRALDLYSDW